MRGSGGREALVAAGLLALLFGVVAGFEITLHAEFDERHDEKPKFDSHGELATNEKLQAANGFDFFTFSQRWPGTFCQLPESCCNTYEQPANFTVDGFFADYEDGLYRKCCPGPAFDQNKLDDELLGELQQYWPRASCSSPTQCNGEETQVLWEAVWDYHGTCAYPTIPSVRDYFASAVILAQRHPLSEILNNAGFVPDSSKEYDTTKLIAAVQDVVGARPTVTCKGNKIYAIQTCFTEQAEARDCLASDSCPPTLVIPPFESSFNSPRFSFPEALRRK